MGPCDFAYHILNKLLLVDSFHTCSLDVDFSNIESRIVLIKGRRGGLVRHHDHEARNKNRNPFP